MLPVQETFGHMQKSASQFMLYVDKVQGKSTEFRLGRRVIAPVCWSCYFSFSGRMLCTCTTCHSYQGTQCFDWPDCPNLNCREDIWSVANMKVRDTSRHNNPNKIKACNQSRLVLPEPSAAPRALLPHCADVVISAKSCPSQVRSAQRNILFWMLAFLH